MCNNKTKIVLALINIIFLALGAAVLGLATWGINHIHAFEGVLQGNSIRAAEAAGALLVVVSALGFFGVVLNEHKIGRFLLIVYNVVLFLLIGLTLAGASVVVIFANKVGKSKYTDSASNQVNKWIWDLYSNDTAIACCAFANGTIATTLQKTCPFYSFLHTNDCASADMFYGKIKHFVHMHFGAIAGILFGAAALQFISSVMACVEIRRGRAAQKQKEAEEAHKAQAAAHPAAAYAPPTATYPGQGQAAQAADHRF